MQASAKLKSFCAFLRSKDEPNWKQGGFCKPPPSSLNIFKFYICEEKRRDTKKWNNSGETLFAFPVSLRNTYSVVTKTGEKKRLLIFVSFTYKHNLDLKSDSECKFCSICPDKIFGSWCSLSFCL